MSSTLREVSKDVLQARDRTYHYYSLSLAAKSPGGITRLPKSPKVLFENLLRWQDGKSVIEEDIYALAGRLKNTHADRETAHRSARVLVQDSTGIPAVVDLAAMREAVKRFGGDTAKVSPLSLVGLVIDHPVTVDRFGDDEAFEENVRLEMERNHERYVSLKRGKQAFSRLSVMPPSVGTCHQVNLEYLGKAVWSELQDSEWIAYPDTLVDTDSHTTMTNGLGVLGWGVDGTEAEAAMLSQPVSMLIPDVVGSKLTGKLREGITAADLVLIVTQMLRKHGVVGKFVEFYGDGLDSPPLADHATIANMSPEYGATCGSFPIDVVTLDYMRLSGRSEDRVELAEKYVKARGMWRNPGDELISTSVSKLDMNNVEMNLAESKRPQNRVAPPSVPKVFAASSELEMNVMHKDRLLVDYAMNGHQYQLSDGAVVIVTITSCTNAPNPSALMTADLLAKKIVTLGLKRQPWIRASLAPGSKVASDYLAKAKLTPYLDELGFNLVGYGCTTCIGNFGPLPDPIETAIKKGDLTVGAVLSGNRNPEGRVHPLVKTNWLASPSLVVAYALAGNMNINLAPEPIGHDRKGEPVYPKDIRPSAQKIARAVDQVSVKMSRREYAKAFEGTSEWKEINVARSDTYDWQEDLTYTRLSPFFDEMQATPAPVEDIHGVRILAMLGDSVTTDHISPAGSTKPDSPAGRYLQGRGVGRKDFNFYDSRRGNHEVTMHSIFANIRIRNEMVPSVEGGMTCHSPDSGVVSIYDATVRYKQEQTPLAVTAGKEYGLGSSCDWMAKGPRLPGIRVVIAEPFERIHRSNLIGMGILPLEFPQGVTYKTLELTGEGKIDIGDLQNLQPGATVPATLTRADGNQEVVLCRCHTDTATELTYYQDDGALHYVIRNILK